MKQGNLYPSYRTHIGIIILMMKTSRELDIRNRIWAQIMRAIKND